MNYAILTGNLGRDPEMRQANGDNVLSFPIGVQTGTKDNPATMWVQCSIWGKRATSLQPYLFKGSRVQVGGPIKLDDYQAKDGTTKQALRLTIDQLDLPPRPAQDQGGYQQQEQQPQSRPAPQPRQAAPSGFDDMDDDIPF
jgi:single-strand DNA-binding protein